MIQATQNEQATKIANWIAPRIDNYEAILFLIFSIALILRISTAVPTDILMVLTLLVLAILYFFNAFAIIDDPYAGGVESFLHKLASWACSITIIGILFRIENWTNYKLMLMTGCCTLVIIFPIILYIKSKKTELTHFNSRYVLRIILICLVGFFLVFVSPDRLVKNKILKVPNIEKAE
jgi:hypothetical protein